MLFRFSGWEHNERWKKLLSLHWLISCWNLAFHRATPILWMRGRLQCDQFVSAGSKTPEPHDAKRQSSALFDHNKQHYWNQCSCTSAAWPRSCRQRSTTSLKTIRRVRDLKLLQGKPALEKHMSETDSKMCNALNPTSVLLFTYVSFIWHRLPLQHLEYISPKEETLSSKSAIPKSK